MNHFFATENSIRKLILTQQATACMSDVERAEFMGLPHGCRIREGAKIISPEKLKLGKYCWIGENAILDASGGLEIGEHTSIGLSVFVWTHDSRALNVAGRNLRQNSGEILRKPTSIGNNCFVAGPSVILPGVTIGDRCVITPFSLVSQNLPNETYFTPYRDMQRQKRSIDLLEKKVKKLEDKIKSMDFKKEEFDNLI